MTKIQKFRLTNEDLAIVLDHHFKSLRCFDKDFEGQKPVVVILPSTTGDYVEITYSLEDAPGLLAIGRPQSYP